jgi:hypothetical protein
MCHRVLLPLGFFFKRRRRRFLLKRGYFPKLSRKNCYLLFYGQFSIRQDCLLFVIMKKLDWQSTLETAGGKITCPHCQAMSKRTNLQCGGPAEKGKQVCRFHGARSTGPKTEEGRLRIALGKTQHGNETRQGRAERSVKTAELLALEDIMHVTGMTTAPRTRGRKPACYQAITTLQGAFEYVAGHPLHSITPVKHKPTEL